jgi:hypothetical protein
LIVLHFFQIHKKIYKNLYIFSNTIEKFKAYGKPNEVKMRGRGGEDEGSKNTPKGVF